MSKGTSFYFTFTGKKIFPNNIKKSDICLEDIAHHLSKINRFGGSLPVGVSYTVAQHSLHLAEYVYIKDENRNLAAALLLHDAAEAYLGDVVSPLKATLSDYKDIEDKVSNIIFNKYNIKLAPRDKRLLDSYDKRILLDEFKWLIPKRFEEVQKALSGVEPLGVPILGNMPDYLLKDHYIKFCRELGVYDK